MPINPNIALGAQPQQPVNMLGQVGQMLALKAATQEMQGNEEMRNLFAGGAKFDDPEFQKRGYMANPKAFQELLGKRATTQKTEIEALSKEVDLRRDAITNIKTPEDYLKWHDANHTGRLGAFFKSAGISPSRESIMAELSKPGGLDKLKRESALGATALQKELMQTERTYGAASISAGPGYERNRMQREKDEYERKNPTLSQVQGENGFYLYNPRDPNSAVPLGMRPTAPPAAAPTAQPSAVNNLMMTTQPTPSVNALVQPAPNQAGPTVAAANALNQQPTIIKPYRAEAAPTLTEVDDPANPGQKLRVDARTYKGGTVGDAGVLGVTRTESLTPAQKQKLKGEISKDFEAVTKTIQETNGLLESIDAVKSSNLDAVSGPVSARTPTIKNESLTAETRFENLKGKVTAIAKAAASMSGAIGSIANQEWQILANQIAVLDLKKGSTANLEQIEQLERQALSIANRMRDGFERKYGADVETLAPQYKELPSVNYTPGQYTTTGRKTSSVDSTNPWLK